MTSRTTVLVAAGDRRAAHPRPLDELARARRVADLGAAGALPAGGPNGGAG
jgi:hypothetical protein